jgi:HSP20 family molecular chaperone IbpA
MAPGEPKTRQSQRTSLFRSSDERINLRRKKAMVIPAANVDETDHEYILTIASPGFKRENLQVLIDEDIITIAAAKESTREYCTHDRCEYDYTRWKRAFTLPDDAVALMTRARYKDGELIIRIPRGKTDRLSGITTIYVY